MKGKKEREIHINEKCRSRDLCQGVLRKVKVKEEINDGTAWFRPGKGMRNQILVLKMDVAKGRERVKDRLLYSVDYSKAFNTIVILWSNMYELGYSIHTKLPLKSVYDQQKATVNTTYACQLNFINYTLRNDSRKYTESGIMAGQRSG